MHAQTLPPVGTGSRCRRNHFSHRWKHEIKIALPRRRAAMVRAVLPNPSARAERLFAGIIDRALRHWGHVLPLDGGPDQTTTSPLSPAIRLSLCSQVSDCLVRPRVGEVVFGRQHQQCFPQVTRSLLSRVPSGVLASGALCSQRVRPGPHSLRNPGLSRVGSSAWFLSSKLESIRDKAALARSVSSSTCPLTLPTILCLILLSQSV